MGAGEVPARGLPERRFGGRVLKHHRPSAIAWMAERPHIGLRTRASVHRSTLSRGKLGGGSSTVVATPGPRGWRMT
jgi:hypothetical protein